MRKYLALLMATTLLASCTKNTPPEEENPPAQTTYTFIDDSDAYSNLFDKYFFQGYVIGEEIEIRVLYTMFEYCGKQRIAENSVENTYSSEKHKFVAKPQTEYVTVQYLMSAKDLITGKKVESSGFLATAFYLTEGQDTEIRVTSTSHTTNTEPKL